MKKRLCLVLAVAFIIFTVSGCNNSQKTSDNTTKDSKTQTDVSETNVESQVTPEDQTTVTLKTDTELTVGSVADDGYEIEIPIGAVEAETAFAATVSDEAPAHDSLRATGDNVIYEFTPQTDDGITRFFEPITITLAVSDDVWNSVENPWDLRFSCWNGTEWDYLEPTSIDTNNQTISLETYHCSLWGTAAPTTEELMREVAAEEARSVFGNNYSDDLKETLNETIDDMLGEDVDSDFKQDLLDNILNNITVATDTVGASSIGTQNIGDYTQLIVAAKNGNSSGVKQNMAAIIGRSFVDVSCSEKWAGFAEGTWDNLDLFIGTGKGVSLMLEGDTDEAAKEFAKAIMSTNLITKLGLTATEIIQNEAERWKDAEIEKAYNIYLNGNSPSRWSLFGYGEIEAGDFDEIYNQMRGIGRHLLADKEAEYIAKNGSISKSERETLESEVREELRTYFENRKKSEEIVNKAVSDNMELLEAMERAELFTSFYGYDSLTQSMSERMYEMLALKDAILADTGLTTGYLNSETTISTEMLIELMMSLCKDDKQGYLDSLENSGHGWSSSAYIDSSIDSTDGYNAENDIEVVDKDILINGNAEDGLTGWIGSENWTATTYEEVSVYPYEGNAFFWTNPSESATMYQDVDISKYEAGSTLVLTGYLCNWDQSPHDMATLTLSLFDEGGTEIYSDRCSQRNPSWKKHSLFVQIPDGAVKARVRLTGTRFVGNDNDAYFDDLSLTVTGMQVSDAVLSCEVDTAIANTSTRITIEGVKASDYIWSSSYNDNATVDSTGCVQFHTSEEVSIYAVNKQTGEELSITFKASAE